jgi:hypothetical protein
MCHKRPLNIREKWSSLCSQQLVGYSEALKQNGREHYIASIALIYIIASWLKLLVFDVGALLTDLMDHT